MLAHRSKPCSKMMAPKPVSEYRGAFQNRERPTGPSRSKKLSVLPISVPQHPARTCESQSIHVCWAVDGRTNSHSGCGRGGLTCGTCRQRMRAFMTTQGSVVAFSVIITEASVFRMSGPAPAVSVFADSLSMMLRRFVTCWKVPETKVAQVWCFDDHPRRCSVCPSLTDTCTALAPPVT